jgi:putative ABC transport system permease protein
VTGIVVLPALGPYQSDRTTPGDGLVVSAEMYDPEDLAEELTFVGIDLAPGASPRSVVASLRDDAAAWSLAGDPARTFAAPVRPPEIVDADSMRSVPLVVGGLLALAATLALVVGLGMAVRARAGELGTLRALGLDGGQLRTTVRVQAVASSATALVVGVPLGVVAGRLAWRAYAHQLGVATAPTVPPAWLLGTVAAGLVLAVLASSIPGRAAARVSAAAACRRGE